MGMDLISIDPNAPEEGQSLHMNWTGWSVFGDLLVELGCDTSEMAGSNDGEILSAQTCHIWAEAITTALAAGRIYALRYADSSFAGGYRHEYHVEGTETPVLLSTRSQVEAIVAQALIGGKVIQEASAEELDTMPTKEVLTPDSEKGRWLTQVAAFLDTCGGCEQW